MGFPGKHVALPYVTSALVLGASLLAGGSSAAKARPAASGGLTITMAMTDTPDTLDPQKTGAAVTASILRYVGDTLVAIDPKTLQVVPDLATSWTVSKNGLVYTFHLRQGVTFQDGTPFNAQAMAFTLERAMNPATHANIAGALVKPISQVQVLGPYVLRIVLKEPYAPFLNAALASPDLMAISPTAVRKEGAQFAQKPVGTGPLEVQQYIPGKSLTLVRNPNYHWAPSFYSNRGPVRFDKLVINFLPNNNTVVNGLLAGELDIGSIQSQYLPRFQNNPQYVVDKYLGQGLNLYLSMNFENPALQNIAVRKAINMAINRQAIIQLVLNGEGVPVYGPLPPTIFGYDPNTAKYGYHYDPTQAKKLLEQAGYKLVGGVMTKGSQKLSFSFYVANFPQWVSAAQIIQQELRAIGIQTKITTLDFASDLADLERGQADLALMGYTYADPDVLYLFLHSSQIHGGLNMSFYRSPKLDQLLVAGREATSQAERKAIYTEIQKFVVQQAIWAPIYTAYQYVVVSKALSGVRVSPVDGVMLQDVQ
jgi:peptide/nickel transport system substrate-binding protein